MTEFQDRVILECQALDAKIKKLELFIANNSDFKNLNPFEQTRLKDQHYHMTRYSELLHSRIIHFND